MISTPQWYIGFLTCNCSTSPPILAIKIELASCVYVFQDRNMVKLNQSRTERVKFGVYLQAFFMRIELACYVYVRMASRKSPSVLSK